MHAGLLHGIASHEPTGVVNKQMNEAHWQGLIPRVKEAGCGGYPDIIKHPAIAVSARQPASTADAVHATCVQKLASL